LLLMVMCLQWVTDAVDDLGFQVFNVVVWCCYNISKLPSQNIHKYITKNVYSCRSVLLYK
jgi:hypothetical protein